MIEQPSFHKNPEKPTCIDLILTNVPRMFQSTCVIDTGLSNFHLITVRVMRKAFKKIRPRVINNLSNEVFIYSDDGLEKFCKITMDTLNASAPIKKKDAHGNQILFITKNFSKKIMTRLRLRNKYLKHKTEEINVFHF